MTGKTRIAPPRAGAMLEALRGLGYSTAAALADLIDNSISAGASEVRVDCSWVGAASRITVLDNGRGMDDAELESAMRLGDKSPLDVRAADDLGRFGMGLKTASFSQCRRLTVASAKAGARACLRWDLDALAANPDGGWLLFEGPAHGSESLLASLEDRQAGTLVLWEALDRIVTSGYKPDDFNDLIDRIEDHVAMVFHRLIQGPRPRLRLLLNGRAVEPTPSRSPKSYAKLTVNRRVLNMLSGVDCPPKPPLGVLYMQIESLPDPPVIIAIGAPTLADFAAPAGRRERMISHTAGLARSGSSPGSGC